MKQPIDRVNKNDPSGTKAIEDRRAEELSGDLERAYNHCLDEMKLQNTMDIEQINRIVDSEMSGFNDASKQKVTEWLIDTSKAASVRAMALTTGKSPSVIARFGPRGLTEDQRKMIAVSVGNNIDGLSQDSKKNLMRAIGDGIANGEGYEDISKRVKDAMNVSTNRAETIARTETMTVFDRATKEQYLRDDVGRVTWLATADERTCPICGEYDGQEYDIDDHPDIPAHPNCRCQLLPVIDSIGESSKVPKPEWAESFEGAGGKFTKQGNAVVYHGTTAEAAEEILKSGKFNTNMTGAYFGVDKAEAEYWAKDRSAGRSSPAILEVEVNPSDMIAEIGKNWNGPGKDRVFLKAWKKGQYTYSPVKVKKV